MTKRAELARKALHRDERHYLTLLAPSPGPDAARRLRAQTRPAAIPAATGSRTAEGGRAGRRRPGARAAGSSRPVANAIRPGEGPMQVRWKVAVPGSAVAAGEPRRSVADAATGAAPPQPMKYDDLTRTQKRLLSGFASSEVDQARGALAAPKRRSTRAAPSGVRLPAGGALLLPGRGRAAATTRLAGAVNMDPTARTSRTAPWPAAARHRTRSTSPRTTSAPGNLLGSSNDYRRGDGGCFAYYSIDNGGAASTTSPFPFGFTRRRAPTATARGSTGRPAATPPAPSTPSGNAYFSCQVFNRGTGRTSEPRPEQRPARVPLDRQRRRLVHVPRAPGGAERPDVAGTGNGAFSTSSS